MTTVSDNCQGFTFIEVMVAMAIIAIVMTALFRMQSGSFALASAQQFKLEARLLASEQLALIEQAPDQWADTRGMFGDDHPNYEWECSIEPVGFSRDSGLPQADAGTLEKIGLTIINTREARRFYVETFRYVSAVGK